MNGICILRVMNGVEVRLEELATTKGSANPGEMSVSVSAERTMKGCLVVLAYAAPSLQGELSE